MPLSLHGVHLDTSVIFSQHFFANLAICAIQILTALITLGGIAVILGGIVILFGRISTGRPSITLGRGAGFMGLAITLVYSSVTLGFSSLLTHSEYWVGVILAVIARSLAKRK